MRSLSSLVRIGWICLWVATMSWVLGGSAVAKSAPESAEASSETSSKSEEKADSMASDETAAVTGESAPEVSEPQAEAGQAESGGTERNWIVDEETGRRYSIEKIPKIERTYMWRDENHIRLPGGLLNIEVVKHDDQWFWVKLWEHKALPKRSPPTSTKPTEEELARSAATFESEAGEVDRIQLTSFSEGLPRAGQWRNGFDVADMNHDGYPDIVFGPSRKGRSRPNIFLNDGQGRWRRWSEARYPELPYDYGDAAVADFNGDGHMDVAFGVHLRGMLAIVGDGAGGFQPWTSGIAIDHPGAGGDASSFSSRAIEVIDWDRDGRPDLLAFGEGPKGVKLAPGGKRDGGMINSSRGLVLYANQGDGTWKPRYVESIPTDYGDDFTIGDFDQDDHPDVAVATRIRGNNRILRNSAAGEDGLLSPVTLELLRTRGRITSVEAANLNGDGVDELLVGYVNRDLGVWRTGIDVFYHDAEEGWTRRILISEESRKGVSSMVTGELDGDGALDVVALTGNGDVWIFLGDGQGFFDREASPETPRPVPGCAGWEVRIVDLDGDEANEVVASFAGERTGPVGLPVGTMPGCSGQGRIEAWKVASRDAEPDSVPAAGTEAAESR